MPESLRWVVSDCTGNSCVQAAMYASCVCSASETSARTQPHLIWCLLHEVCLWNLQAGVMKQTTDEVWQHAGKVLLTEA